MDCSASASLYPAVEGAFGQAGGSGDVGQCPAPPGGLDCAGAVSNCWSPGQRDTGEMGYSKVGRLYFLSHFRLSKQWSLLF